MAIMRFNKRKKENSDANARTLINIVYKQSAFVVAIVYLCILYNVKSTFEFFFFQTLRLFFSDTIKRHISFLN